MTQPTHDVGIKTLSPDGDTKSHLEVIAWIDESIENIDDFAAELFQEEVKASLLANRAVLKRHKPQPLMGGSLLPEFQCADGCGNFPCPTYTDIADQLDLVMGASND